MKKLIVLCISLFLILFFDGENKVMAQREGSRSGDGQAQPRIIEYPGYGRPQPAKATTTTTTNHRLDISVGAGNRYGYYNYGYQPYYDQPYRYQPYICVVNQYTNYMNTIYYIDHFGYRTGRGYHIYRTYTHYSNGATAWSDRYLYF